MNRLTAPYATAYATPEAGGMSDAELSLEKILERLGQVVEGLEKGDLALEKALELFEEGVRLTREGQRRLDAAEKRIEAVAGAPADG